MSYSVMPVTFHKTSILFLCTHNSARSQLAEALMRNLSGDHMDVFSAGTERTRVKPEVLTVLQEKGIPTDNLHSKTLDDLGDRSFDVVVTVCDQAHEACPFARGTRQTIHHSFPDPSLVTRSPEARLQAFRSTRDAIQQWLRELVSSFPSSP